MSLIKSIGVIALCYIGCVLAFDLAGVLLVTFLPEPGGYRLNGSAGFGSVALYYAVWLVAGCFAGAFFISLSLEATKLNTLVQRQPLIIPGIALVLSVALILFFYAVGEMQDPRFNFSNDYYVPGHRNVTYTYFISFLLICLLLRNREKKK